MLSHDLENELFLLSETSLSSGLFSWSDPLVEARSPQESVMWNRLGRTFFLLRHKETFHGATLCRGTMELRRSHVAFLLALVCSVPPGLPSHSASNCESIFHFTTFRYSVWITAGVIIRTETFINLFISQEKMFNPEKVQILKIIFCK